MNNSFRIFILITQFLLVFSIDDVRGQNCPFKLTGFNQESTIAYLGVTNKIKTDIEIIKMESNNGNIKLDTNGFTYSPERIGEALLTYSFKTSDTQTSVSQVCTVLVQYLPFTFEVGHRTTFFNPVIQIEKEELKNTNFHMRSTNTNLSAHAKILEFDLSIKRNKTILIETSFKDYGMETRNKISKLFNMVEANDTIIFDNLTYQYLDNHPIKHHQIKLLIN